VSRIKTDAENHRVVFDGTMDDLAGALRLPGSQERSEAPPREQGTEAPGEERHETRRHLVRVVRQGVETEHEMKPGQQHPLAAETFEVPVAQQKMVVERGAETGEIVIRSEVVQAQPEAQHGERVKVKDQEMEDEEEDRPEGSL
jgi:hypothetical protein